MYTAYIDSFLGKIVVRVTMFAILLHQGLANEHAYLFTLILIEINLLFSCTELN